MGIIYKTTNTVNDKIYVGQTTYRKKNYIGSGKLLHRAIKKYGFDSFKFEVLETCDNSLLNDRERYWIAKLQANVSGIGYNLTGGGEGFEHGALNPVHRPEVKAKISRALKANNGSFRPEVREKISKTLRGRKLSEDHCKAVSDGLRGHAASKGIDNPLSKQYIVVHPDGHTENIVSLRSFCRDHELSKRLLRKTIRIATCKHHKHYKLLTYNIWPRQLPISKT